MKISITTAPLVSIIIPSYNYGHLILDTLESILRQHYQNWECIIVDDGSTDHSAEIVTNFIAKHPNYNIRFYPVENGGTSAAKNIGIKYSQGKYLQFLDADDLLSEDKLSTQVALAEASAAALIFSRVVFFRDEPSGRQLVQRYPRGFLATESLENRALLKRLVTNNILTINSPLVRKNLILEAGQFDQHLRNNEDWLLWFKVALLNPCFHYDGDERSVALVRLHGNSAMNNQKKMFLGEVVVRSNMEAALSGWRNEAEGLSLRKLNSDLLALHQVRSLEFSKGLRYIFSSFAKKPVQEWSLLKRGLLKLCIRLYRNIN